MRIDTQRIVLVMCATALLLASPHTALAQNSEISGGYSCLRWQEIDYPMGWYGEVGHRVGSHVEWLATVAGTYRTTAVVGGGNATVQQRFHEVATGGRFELLSNARVSPFGDLLLGLMHASADFTVPPGTPGENFINEVLDDAVTKSALHLQGGLHARITNRAGARLILAYHRLLVDHEDGGPLNQLRVIGAVSYKF
jgi:hypothetical protein